MKREHGNEQWAKLILCMMISGINTNQHYYTIVPPTHASLKRFLLSRHFFAITQSRAPCVSLSGYSSESSHRGEPARRRRKLYKISYVKSHWLSQLFSESPLDFPSLLRDSVCGLFQSFIKFHSASISLCGSEAQEIDDELCVSSFFLTH